VPSSTVRVCLEPRGWQCIAKLRVSSFTSAANAGPQTLTRTAQLNTCHPPCRYILQAAETLLPLNFGTAGADGAVARVQSNNWCQSDHDLYICQPSLFSANLNAALRHTWTADQTRTCGSNAAASKSHATSTWRCSTFFSMGSRLNSFDVAAGTGRLPMNFTTRQSKHHNAIGCYEDSYADLTSPIYILRVSASRIARNR
jgi:hypothetical protein